MFTSSNSVGGEGVEPNGVSGWPGEAVLNSGVARDLGQRGAAIVVELYITGSATN